MIELLPISALVPTRHRPEAFARTLNSLAQQSFQPFEMIVVDGSEDGATLSAPNADGLVEGAGPDAGIGADVDSLTFITEDLVGPGSTWTAP